MKQTNYKYSNEAMTLTEQETTQLYVFLNMFAKGMPTDKDTFPLNGQARTLAAKLTEYIQPYSQITLTYKTDKQCEHSKYSE